MMGVAAARYDPDVEAALLHHYGVRPVDVSLRSLRSLVHRLPPGAWPDHENEMFWSNEAHLLAGVIDAVNNLTWQLVAINTPAGKPKPQKVKPVPRPQPPKRMSWGQLADLIDGGAAA